MPINKPMMKSMKKEYGAKKGEKVYYAVEMKQKESGKMDKKMDMGKKEMKVEKKEYKVPAKKPKK